MFKVVNKNEIDFLSVGLIDFFSAVDVPTGFLLSLFSINAAIRKDYIYFLIIFILFALLSLKGYPEIVFEQQGTKGWYIFVALGIFSVNIAIDPLPNPLFSCHVFRF